MLEIYRLEQGSSCINSSLAPPRSLALAIHTTILDLDNPNARAAHLTWTKEIPMLTRSIILWFLGIPIPVILLLALFFR
jgi:hypothetical protein